MYEIVFTPVGKKDLQKLPKDIQKRVIEKIQFFSSQENPLLFATTLVNFPPLTHRFRVGNYRIAFYIHLKIIYIDRIRHRKEVYI